MNAEETDQPRAGGPWRVFRWYERVMEWFGASLMAIILVVMVAQVIARYAFNSSFIWAEELCRYILIWITFLFIGLAYSRGELVALDFVTAPLGRRGQYVLKVVMSIPLVIFLFLMVTNGFEFYSRFAARKIPAIDFIWQALGFGNAGVTFLWVYYSVPVGIALLILHIIGTLSVEGYTLFRDGKQSPITEQHEVTR